MSSTRAGDGIVYLLHFERPFHHARHYIGFCEHDLPRRLDQHQRGSGSRLVAAIRAAGISFELARTWVGDRHFERRLHRRNGAARICPLCGGSGAIIEHQQREVSA